ncbi:MAG: hypothetical protein IJ253_07045 [Bacteroidaceae bacterium]|nr:hypothetical protein [Bacteroidaceae bacterium]
MDAGIQNLKKMAAIAALAMGCLLQTHSAILPTDDISRMKEKFESCKMLTVGKDELGYAIKVPEFFRQVPTEDLYTQRYLFVDEASGMQFAVSTFIEDNTEGLDAETAVKEFTQEATPLFTEIGADYYIIEGFVDVINAYVDLEKSFFIGRYCLSLHFFFPKNYRRAVQRYIDIVKAWNPYPEE